MKAALYTARAQAAPDHMYILKTTHAFDVQLRHLLAVKRQFCVWHMQAQPQTTGSACCALDLPRPQRGQSQAYKVGCSAARDSAQREQVTIAARVST